MCIRDRYISIPPSIHTYIMGPKHLLPVSPDVISVTVLNWKYKCLIWTAFLSMWYTVTVHRSYSAKSIFKFMQIYPYCDSHGRTVCQMHFKDGKYYGKWKNSAD